MSTASEQRAWGRNRPASIGRPPVPQSRSSVTSPNASGASTPTPAAPKQPESKPLATVKPADQAKPAPAPAPAGNVWAQRKAAQEQARAVPNTTIRDSRAPAAADASKKSENVGASAHPAAAKKDEGYTPAGGFNANEVREFLKRDAASFKTYRMAESNPKPASAGSRSNMANGQSFFATLSKQVTQLQGSK
ncbi:hypothetical protein C1H76_0317 [Elsinoe australis]|uniref:Uncharacterized protein n=1 Tax=Elsinoe australis TaxID=40998 RepID=A0A4U7BCC3_9PEZI|nr:hypothetical protein C1H76_0317 [Elsinoe australis]